MKTIVVNDELSKSLPKISVLHAYMFYNSVVQFTHVKGI